jgi:uncharacterized hydrophobic protein (TIGR00271 family)
MGALWAVEYVEMPPAEQSLRQRIETLLRIDPTSKPAVYRRIDESAALNDLNYWLELVLSAAIATLGLVLDSPAVVIGAMLISPLMGPIIGAGLALATADLYLGIKSSLNLAASVVGAIALSALIVWLIPFQSPTSEILARTHPNLLDLGVAIFSGLAGSLIVCRGGHGGGVTALPGVAIAVALMPPLCTVGFGVGSGFNWAIISGAGLLFLTNLAAITAAAFAVFYIARMDAPEVRSQIDATIRQRGAHDWLYNLLAHTRLARSLADIGKLRWRVTMLSVVLIVLYVPLRDSLLQLRDETVARTAVREAIRSLASSEEIVSQQIEIGSDRIRVRLVLTGAVGPDRIAEAERQLIRRTGKEVSLLVRKVAGEEELAMLRQTLRPPAPEPVLALESIRADVAARLGRILQEIWPSTEAELRDYELGLSPNSIRVRLRYEAPKALPPAAVEMLTRLLRARLAIAELELVTEQIPPPQAQPAGRTSRR